MAISFGKKSKEEKKDLLLWYNVTKQEIMLSTLPDTDLQALIVSDFQVTKSFRSRLHQASTLRLPQLCDDVGDTFLIQINEVAPE